ncbi:hypothetical protein N658DRAFT_494019 [Parathielavia hyrcaniae]|uniref:Uncharacterized protein n=1 Tax=Parathielavia hyrcaniae TaxID=113614 RepID=A0AAN6Q4Q8_9PEZI|nr:hypothetical protein N658DRAFT_494019 [Parathielavia hyrcaniae]
MLERTATSIEPCSSSLQRVLPSTRSCLHTRRKLHTAFWHHGAAEFDVIDACQALLRQRPRESQVHATPANASKSAETMTASTGLLDFLYPSGAAALLRRPSLIYPIRLEAGPRPHNHMLRLFTSAVPRPSNQPPESHAPPDPFKELEEAASGHSRGRAVVKPSEAPEGPEALEKLLRSNHAGAYDQIFQVWTALEPDLQEDYMIRVMLAISASARPIEAWRVVDFFACYPVQSWTEDIVRAAVKAHLTLHNVPEAMSIFKAAVEQRRFGQALDYIVAYGFELSSWDLVLRAWELYSSNLGEAEPDFGPPALTAAEPEPEPEPEPGEAQEMGQGAELAQHEGIEPGLKSAATAQETESVPEPGTSETDTGKEQPQRVGAETQPSPSQAERTVSDAMGAHEVEPTAGPTPAEVMDKWYNDAVGGVTGEQPVKSLAVQEPASLAEAVAPSTQNQSPGTIFGYPTLAATANFEAKVNEMYRSLENDPETLPQRTALVESFLRHLVRCSMHLFQPSDVVSMLRRAPDPRSYERFIVLNAEQGRNKLATDLFKKYRALPGVRTPVFVLRAMVDVFFPHNTVGMEAVLRDWYRYHGHLDERAYRKFMVFYGGRGDVRSIMRLAGEYAKHYDYKVEEDSKYCTTLMQAHAVRGDPEAAHRVMREGAERSGNPPEIRQWNILMNAHVKAGDYEGAIGLFSYVCDALEPDDNTFGAMMGMAGVRGDLQFTLELYQLARERRVKPTVTMMRALVEAYCQNDRLNEAEQLCIRITKKRDLNGDLTVLWNALLHHNAKRRDLTTVNRLLELMSAQGIAYSQETYNHLLLALLYARQAHHAMHLLRVAHQQGVFEPTADHFILLMSAFINTGEPHMVLKTNELMSKLKFPQSAMRMTKVIDALGRWQQLPYTKRRGVTGTDYLKQILSLFYKSLERENQGSPDDIRSVIGLYNKVLFILTQMREHTTVQEVIRLHNARYPNRASNETLPLKLLHQMMLADFYEKKYDSVKQTWDLVLRRATQRYQPATSYLGSDQKRDPGQDADADQAQDQGRDQDLDDGTPPKPVIYAQRFRLCDPLKTMQRLYLEEQDADGLLGLIASVRRRGFDLDSKNWNYHVQALARLKRWREAFSVCEKVLMPQWTGWYQVRAEAQAKNRVPLALRRIGTNPHRPRPISHTLLLLAKEYMDLEKMMLWSREAGREFRYINDECPKTVYAVTTMHRTGSSLEYAIFDDEGAAAGARRGPLGHELGDDEVADGDQQGGGEGRYQGRGKVRETRTWRGGRSVRPADKRRIRTSRRKSEIWTEGGFLNSPDSAPKEEGGMSAEDVVSAIKAGGSG